MNTIINTISGPVRGQLKTTDENKEYLTFFNIPYAKKFIGEAVFKDPEPVEPWTEVLDATQESQHPFFIDAFASNQCEGSLDKVGINIYTPNVTPKEPLPVFVHIHGGAFIYGSNSPDLYGPDFLIEKDIVMVSINYRLNIFGFLSFKDPKLGIPGNAGLKDQNLALKWIKANIENFGGDPNNITLCGESAGAASVNYHMVSPMSKNLFNRAILMSGSAFSPWASIPEDFEKYMDRLVKKLGMNGDESEEMIFKKICETKPEELLKLTLEIVDFEDKFFGSLLLSPFLPRVETHDNGNSFLPESIKTLSENAWSKDIDLMMGAGSMEGDVYYVCGPSDDDLAKVDKDHSLLLPLEQQLTLSEEEKLLKGRFFKELYFGDNPINKTTEAQYFLYMADKITWHPKLQTISYRQKHGCGQTFVYRVNLPPSKDVPEFYDAARSAFNLPNHQGTAHGEDTPLLFKTKIARRFNPNDDLYPSWQKFLQMFTNFIKNGNPNSPNMEQWSAISKTNLQHFEMNSSNWQMDSLINLDKLHQWS